VASARFRGVGNVIDRISALQLFNTRYVTTDLPLSQKTFGPDAEVFAEIPQLNIRVVKLRRALPRAFVAAPLFANDLSAAMHLLASPGVLEGQRVVLEGGGWAENEQPSTTSGTATITRYLPERVEIEAQLEAPGALVLNDAFDPNAKLSVDGRVGELRRANVLVTAVLLPPGQHHLVFEHPAPFSLRVGMAVSLFSLLGLLGVVALMAWRKTAIHPAARDATWKHNFHP